MRRAIPVVIGLLLLTIVSVRAPPVGADDFEKNQGSKAWAIAYEGTANYFLYAIRQASDGGFVAAGTRDYQNWVIRLNSHGKILWQKSIGFGRLFSLLETPDEGFILAGDTLSSAGQEVSVLKLDEAGNVVWQKDYSSGGVGDLGGAMDMIQPTSDGGFIILGDVVHCDLQSCITNVWVSKLDPMGDIVWAKEYGGSGTQLGNSVVEASDGGFVLVGVSYAYGFSYGAGWIVKLDTGGNIVWQRIYSGPGYSEARSVQRVSDGGFVIAGITQSSGPHAWVLRLDAAGNILWQKVYGEQATSSGLSIEGTSDGGYVVNAFSYSFGTGDVGAWIFKVDSMGSIVWQRFFGHTLILSLQQTSDGRFVASGGITLSNGFREALVLRLSANGKIPHCDFSATTHTKESDIAKTTTDTHAQVFNSFSSALKVEPTVTTTDAFAQVQCPSMQESD